MIERGHEEIKMESTRRKPTRDGWSSAIFIIFVEFAERFAFYGLLGNLIIYLTTVLGETTATAAKNVNTWVGISAILPLIGAFISDSYSGRYKTIAVSCVIYLMGMVLLTLSVSVIPLNHREVVFFIALYTLSVGGGGFRPCVQPFAADQFDENKPEELDAKNSFFNWWYVAIMGGMFFSTIVVITLQDNVGWAAGFGVLAATMAFALILFLSGTKRYKIHRAEGSPFVMVAQVLVAAVRKWRTSTDENLVNRNLYYKEIDGSSDEDKQPVSQTKIFRFLDKAMIIDKVDASRSTRNPWRLCSPYQVEEVKLVLRLIPIWLTGLIFTNVNAMFSTFFIKQGGTMIRSIGPLHNFPPSGLQCLVASLIIIFIPIYDRVFVPAVRKLTGHPTGITILQRIGIGLFFSVLEMSVAALVEAKRVNTAREYGLLDMPKVTIPMSVWWLLPQYILGALADVFTLVGLPQIFYDEMPLSLRSLGGACYLSVIGVGSFLNTAIISIVQAISSRYGDTWLGNNLNRAHLNYFYWVNAVLCAVNLCVFIWIARSFRYRKVDQKPETSSGS